MILAGLNIVASVVVALVVHEAGHLIAARCCNVKVSEAGLGWGPTLYALKVRDISYQLRALPVGAFVRMDMRELQRRSLMQQLIILLAGIGVNLLFGLIAWGTFFGSLNLVLAVVNLFPLYQQDGWKIGIVLFRKMFRKPSPFVEWCFTISSGILALTVMFYMSVLI